MELTLMEENRFDAVYEKMESAFPYEERREKEEEKKCLSNEHFRLFECEENGEYVGFTAVWEFSAYLFVEHLAINENCRSNGYGTKVLNLLKEKFNKPIVLEVEPPFGEQQKKRIAFYERFGFSLNGYPYNQPSYHGGEELPLILMSFPNCLTEEEFSVFLAETRQEVYGIN